MTSIKNVRNKIISVQNTQKITKAMEMIAASKMRKSQEQMMSSSPYIKMIRQVINHITLGNVEYKHPYINKRDVKSVGYFVISTDHGLAGGLNINLFKKLLIDINEYHKKGINTKILLVGTKAISFFSSMNIEIITQISGIDNKLKLSKLIGPIRILLKLYDNKSLDKIYIVNNKFINTISQHPQITQILPLFIEDNSFTNHTTWDYLYEPDSKILLDKVIFRYIEAQIYQSVIENLACEQAARMVAMKTATDNANSLIKDLKFVYNKVRQTSVTQELSEIISGVFTL